MQLLLSNYSWWGWSKRFSLSFVVTGGIIYIVLKEFSTSFIFRFEWTFAPTINKKEKQVMDLWNFAYFLPLMCMHAVASTIAGCKNPLIFFQTLWCLDENLKVYLKWTCWDVASNQVSAKTVKNGLLFRHNHKQSHWMHTAPKIDCKLEKMSTQNVIRKSIRLTTTI